MRAAVGKKALERSAASSQTVSRFETETLATDENIGALSSINRARVSRAMRAFSYRAASWDRSRRAAPEW